MIHFLSFSSEQQFNILWNPGRSFPEKTGHLGRLTWKMYDLFSGLCMLCDKKKKSLKLSSAHLIWIILCCMNLIFLLNINMVKTSSVKQMEYPFQCTESLRIQCWQMHWPQAEKLSAFNVIQFDISSFHLGTTFSNDNNESKFTQKFSTSHCQNTWLIVFET